LKVTDVARIRKLVSGGQTGVDRAALDFAIEHNIPYGGWVPRGGRAEDMPKPPGLLAIYPELREHSSRDWAPRTEANVINSGATLIVVSAPHQVGPGTKLTIKLALQHHKPYLVLDVGETSPSSVFEKTAGEKMFDFLEQFDADIALNVAGSRESSIPGIYSAAKRVLATFDTGDLFAS
jgi:hypothetical protein